MTEKNAKSPSKSNALVSLVERLKWPLVLVIFLAVILWVVVVALGETLGVPPALSEQVADAFRIVWVGAMTLMAPLVAHATTLLKELITRDTDGDGKWDIVDDSISPPPMPKSDKE